jgi:hypothetical protein
VVMEATYLALSCRWNTGSVEPLGCRDARRRFPAATRALPVVDGVRCAPSLLRVNQGSPGADAGRRVTLPPDLDGRVLTRESGPTKHAIYRASELANA